MRFERLFLAVAAALLPATALAQAPSCNLPAELARPRPELPGKDEPKRVMPIGGYTLAIVWTPQFCRARGGKAQDSVQCGGGNRFGFTLHGLWPDGPGKTWPQYCRTAELLPEAVIRANLCTTPSAQLLQHEWAKHGTCMAQDPQSYFGTSTRLYRGLRYPDMDALSHRRLTAAAFARAFADANPGIDPGAVRLNLGKGGWLEEVWLCLGAGLSPRRCPATQGGVKGSVPVKIWRGTSAPRSRRS